MGRKTGTVAYIKNKPGTVSRAEGKREKRQEEGKKNREKMAQERDIEREKKRTGQTWQYGILVIGSQKRAWWHCSFPPHMCLYFVKLRVQCLSIIVYIGRS